MPRWVLLTSSPWIISLSLRPPNWQQLDSIPLLLSHITVPAARDCTPSHAAGQPPAVHAEPSPCIMEGLKAHGLRAMAQRSPAVCVITTSFGAALMLWQGYGHMNCPLSLHGRQFVQRPPPWSDGAFVPLGLILIAAALPPWLERRTVRLQHIQAPDLP